MVVLARHNAAAAVGDKTCNLEGLASETGPRTHLQLAVDLRLVQRNLRAAHRTLRAEAHTGLMEVLRTAARRSYLAAVAEVEAPSRRAQANDAQEEVELKAMA